MQPNSAPFHLFAATRLDLALSFQQKADNGILKETGSSHGL
jgi:hypothetical protein